MTDDDDCWAEVQIDYSYMDRAMQKAIDAPPFDGPSVPFLTVGSRQEAAILRDALSEQKMAWRRIVAQFPSNGAYWDKMTAAEGLWEQARAICREWEGRA